MSYSITVGVKGAEKQIEALTQFLGQAVNNESSSQAVNDFFGELGLSANPLKKSSREFSLPGDDSDDTIEIDDPWPFCDALSGAFPLLGFFCIGYVNTDEGNGVEYKVYKDGVEVEGDNNFYDGSECGGYAITHVPADACAEWVKAQYAFWRIEDSGDEDAIDVARKTVSKTRQEWSCINDFLLDGGVDECLDTDANTLRMAWGSCLDVLRLLENEGGYNGYSITSIETIDFSENDPQDWEDLPDLSVFTGLKTLNLTGTSITEIPERLTKKIQAGTLEVIGFNADDKGGGINSEEDALALVWEDPENIFNIPEAYQTRTVYLAVAEQRGAICERIPETIQSEDFFREAVQVNKNGKALKYVPEEYLTVEVCALALRLHPELVDELIDYVPEALKEQVKKAAGIE